MNVGARVLAPIVQCRTPTWPNRMANYFDCSQWGGGLVRLDDAPGAITLNLATGTMLNIRTGEVYTDERFALGPDVTRAHAPCTPPGEVG